MNKKILTHDEEADEIIKRLQRIPIKNHPRSTIIWDIETVDTSSYYSSIIFKEISDRIDKEVFEQLMKGTK